MPDIKEIAISIFHAAETMTSQLPVRMSNGSYMDKLTMSCTSCSNVISSDQMRGFSRSLIDGCHFKGYGYCVNCQNMTPFSFKIVEDGVGWELVPILIEDPDLQEPLSSGKLVKIN